MARMIQPLQLNEHKHIIIMSGYYKKCKIYMISDLTH